MHMRGNYKATALAAAMNVNEATISRWKRNGPITLDHAVGLCETLEVSMDWLIRGIGDPNSGIWLEPERAGAAAEVTKRAINEMRALLIVIENQNLHRTQVADLAAQGKRVYSPND